MTYSDSKRNEKRNQIVTTSSKLLKSRDYKEISIKMISENLGWAKGTIYNFFKSKEEIFIALYLIELEKWLLEIEEIFSLKESPEDILDIFVERHCKRVLFIKLMSILNSVLEGSLSYEASKNFKFTLLEKLIPISQKVSLSKIMKVEEVGPFLIHYTAHVIGLYQMSNISDNLKRIFNRYPELEVFNPQFEKELKNYVQFYFYGQN
jgi:AcrR family transcriptional regulator